MSIQIGPNDQSNAGSSPAPAPSTYAPSSPAPAFNDNNPFGFAGVQLTPGRQAIGPIRNQIGAENYDNLAKQLREFVRDNQTNSKLKIEVHLLDRSVHPSIYFIGFVFTSQSKDQPNLGVGYNIVLLEATNQPLPPVPQSYGGGEKADIPRYAESSADAFLDNLVVMQVLRPQYGDVPFYKADAQIVPTSFNPKDERSVKNLAANAAQAATTNLVMLAANGRWFDHDLNLVAELKSDSRGGDADLTFITSQSSGPLYDHLGVPYRASIIVQAATGYRRDNNNQRSVNDGSGPRILNETLGFVDLMPSRPRQAPMLMPASGPYGGMMIDQRRLRPVFVIENVISNFANTPGSLFLNFLVAADLGTRGNWARAFSQRGGVFSEKSELTDVRAIVLDFPDPQNPTKPTPKPPAADFGLGDDRLMHFLGTYCQPELTLAFDVPVASANTWQYSLFYAAAVGNPSAVARLNKAVDDLCGGKFAPLLAQKSVAPFSPNILDIEYGYWEDDKNRLRSTSEVDYVAVANYAERMNNPDLIEKFTSTFLDVTRAPALRMQDRRNIIVEVLGPSVQFTGRSKRLFWNGEYLALALQALNSAGITTSSDSNNSFSFGPRQAHAEFLNTTGMPSNAGWNTVIPGSGNTYGFGGFNTSPWG
jgi:hypothetical protein